MGFPFLSRPVVLITSKWLPEPLAASSRFVLTEPVHLESYNSHWPDIFECERDRIAGTTHARLEDVQHIGSTAVPGLSAKPIVDIMLGVTNFPPDPMFLQNIVTLGYESLGEAGVLGRLYFRNRAGDPFNLHLVQWGGIHWIANLQLRNYLRSSADARERYSAAKLAAIESGAVDLLTYSEHKASIVTQLIAEASQCIDRP